jgi:BirA family transcriptional regulator, biotin operon repressor / biotin---[acetyl-CoA-carboxylase] ligase
MKFKIYKFKKVTSTNDVAINLIRNENKLSGYVNTKIQTKGRGTSGKRWISNDGNLFSTLFFPLEKKYPPFNEFSIINSIIIANIIKKICNIDEVNLKFPNDIFLNRKKICGILQEVITKKNKEFLIIGIGLNLVSSPKNIDNSYKATNIFEETKKKPKINELTNVIIKAYEKFFNKLNIYSFENYKKKANLISIN